MQIYVIGREYFAILQKDHRCIIHSTLGTKQ